MIIDGRKIAADIIIQLRSEVAGLPFQPVFCDILVGDDPVSAQYVNLKAGKAVQAGIRFLRADFTEHITTEKLVDEIRRLNQAPDMCGLIVQLPLPLSVDRQSVVNAVDPVIDVDCIGQTRNAKFYEGDLEITPPTAAAVMHLLDGLGLDLKSKNILVIGQGGLVGRPVTHLLRQRKLEINIADIQTANTDALLRQADVIISATGQPKLITAEKIKRGCVIIDAGTAEDNGEIVGDVDFESVANKASVISPVPGGVGPVTVAMLFSNVVKVAKQKNNVK